MIKKIKTKSDFIVVEVSLEEHEKYKKAKKVSFSQREARELLKSEGFQPGECVKSCRVSNFKKKEQEGEFVFYNLSSVKPEVFVEKPKLKKKRKSSDLK